MRFAARPTRGTARGQVVVVAAAQRRLPAEIVAIARNPSHLGSNSHWSPSGSARGRGEHRRHGPAVAASFRSSNQLRASPSSAAGTSVQIPSTLSPWRCTVSPPSRFSSTSSYVPRSQISTEPAPYCPPGSRPRSPRSRADDPRHARRVALAGRGPLRDGPARERAVALEPKVVVEAPGRWRWTTKIGAPRPAAPANGSGVRDPLAAVRVEAHLWIVARTATVPLPTCCKTRLFPAQAAVT